MSLLSAPTRRRLRRAYARWRRRARHLAWQWAIALEQIHDLALRPPRFRPGMSAAQTGALGERWVRWHYLRRRGASTMAANWRGGGGELDIVAWEPPRVAGPPPLIVFIEVKTRAVDDPRPLDSMGAPSRRDRFRRAGLAWWAVSPTTLDQRVRYDVVVVTPYPDRLRDPDVEIHPDIFDTARARVIPRAARRAARRPDRAAKRPSLRAGKMPKSPVP